MKTKLRVLLFLSLFFALAALGVVGTTFGWFAHYVTFTTQDIGAGDLRYEESGAFIAGGQTIVPGQELVATALAVDNASTVPSQLRVRIVYTRCTNLGEVVCEDAVYAGSVDDHLAVVFGTGFSYDEGYWYYSAAEPGTDYALAAASGPLSVITSILYDGAKTGIDYAGQTIDIAVEIQIKQADNVAWTVLSGYDFSTGHPS